MAVTPSKTIKAERSNNKESYMTSPKNRDQNQNQNQNPNRNQNRNENQDQVEAEQQSERNSLPGVRVKGGRIYDPKNGKSCHQCRQKTMDFTASCKQIKKDNKPCTIKFCYKCLLNRYGEKAEEMEALDNWSCPKCRGICNCSLCMKKKGHQPTGILVHTAKATGFSSVFELLDKKGMEVLNALNNTEKKPSPKASPANTKVMDAKKRSCEVGNEKLCESKVKKNLFKKPKTEGENKENVLQIDIKKESQMGESESKDSAIIIEQTKDKVRVEPLRKKARTVEYALERLKELDADISKLPGGTLLSEVAGVKLPTYDVGPSLQFLEFCRAFSKVLNIKKGQAECILQEIAKGRIGRRGLSSAIIQFQISLLSIIQTDRGEDPISSSPKNGELWLNALGRCISESNIQLNELPQDCFNSGLSGYDNLDSFKKLSILNFLCDEILCTEKMRSWIEKANAESTESGKIAREKLLAAKRKERETKEKLKNDMARVMISERKGAPLSVSEHSKLISEIKEESERAHAELLDTMELFSKKERRDAVRTEAMVMERTGRIYWNLPSYFKGSNILLQDIESWDLNRNEDNWFCFNQDEEKVIEGHISSIRKWKKKIAQSSSKKVLNSSDLGAEGA